MTSVDIEDSSAAGRFATITDGALESLRRHEDQPFVEVTRKPRNQ